METRNHVKLLSCVQLFATPRTITYQDPLYMRFYRQEYWSGLPFPSPGDLPNPGIKARSPALQADSSLSETPGKPPSIIQRETTKYYSPLGWRRKKIPLPHEKILSQSLNFSKFLIPTTNFRRYRGQRSILYYTVEIPTAETQMVGNATGQMTWFCQ